MAPTKQRDSSQWCSAVTVAVVISSYCQRLSLADALPFLPPMPGYPALASASSVAHQLLTTGPANPPKPQSLMSTCPYWHCPLGYGLGPQLLLHRPLTCFPWLEMEVEGVSGTLEVTVPTGTVT